jgi:flagellar protein FliS
MSTAQQNPYLRDAVLTASPEQLQLMLYDGAIRFCHQAKDALSRKDYETSFERLTRAQNIILEMQSGLRPEVNRELCQRMSAIYNFLYRKLIDANVKRSAGEIDDALRVLEVERETWQILVNKVNQVRQSNQEAAVAFTGDVPRFTVDG